MTDSNLSSANNAGASNNNADETKRETLTGYFSDNETPTGDEFREFIESTVIQEDDHILIHDDAVQITSELNVVNDLTIGDRGQLSPDEISLENGSAALSSSQLKAGDNFEYSTSTGLTLNQNASISGQAKMGSAEIGSADTETHGAIVNVHGDGVVTGGLTVGEASTVQDNLTVEGELKVTQEVEIGNDDHSGKLRVNHKGDKSSVLVEHTDDNNRRTTQLCLDEEGRLSLGLNEGQAQAQLHIYHGGSNSEAIIKVDDTADDARPFIVKGDGRVGIATSVPENELDIAGSVRIGRTTASVHEDNSLSVENKVGVGTESPEARVDIRANTEETALNISHGGKATLTANPGIVATDKDTDLTVGRNLTVDHIATVNGETHLQGHTKVNAKLDVNALSEFHKHADFNHGLNVDGHTTVDHVTADEKATFKKQVIVEGDAKYAKSVGIGVGIDDNHNATASLHVKQHSQPGLKVDTPNNLNALSVDGSTVQFGATDALATVDVKGDVDIQESLTVSADSHLNGGASVEQQLKINQSGAVQDDNGMAIPAVEVLTNGENRTGLTVKNQNGEAESVDVFTVKDTKVGVLTDAPEKDLHVAGEAQIDGDTYLKSNVDITGEVAAHGPAKLDQTLTVGLAEGASTDSRVHVAMPEFGNTVKVEGSDSNSPTLTIREDAIGVHNSDPQCALDVKGDVVLNGVTKFNDVVKVNNEAMTLQVTTEEVMVNGVPTQQPVEGFMGIQLTPTNLGINVNEPQADFHLKGSAKLAGTTQATNVIVDTELTSNGISNFNNNVHISAPISANTSELDPSIDLHVRQSLITQTPLRVDGTEQSEPTLIVKPDSASGKLGINTATPAYELDVSGRAHITDAVTTDSTFTVAGETTLNANTFINENLSLSVENPTARVHINDDGREEGALRIDSYYKGEDAPLVYKQGMLGLGYQNPKAQLDVKGDALISDELTVYGQTKLEHTLYVDKDALFKSDLTVNKDTELVGQAVLGQVNEINPEFTPNSQLYIADTRYKEALRIDSTNYASLVFTQGKLGIGKSDPRVALDVAGEFRVSQAATVKGELEVEGILKARDNIEGAGSLSVAQRANFGSDVKIRGDLVVEDKTNIEEELFVTGKTELQADLDVKQNTTLEGSLDVSGEALFMRNTIMAGQLDVAEDLNVEKDLHVSGGIYTGVESPQAYFHLQTPVQQTPFILEKKNTNAPTDRLLTVNQDGNMGLGTSTPSNKLDVMGSVLISDQLTVQSVNAEANIQGRDLTLRDGFQIGGGPKVLGVSEDPQLGGDGSLNSIIPTQAAIKTYIDNVAVPFGRGGKTYTISSQRDFDELFNKSSNTHIAEDTTVILLPLNSNGVSAYQLKNTVTLRSGVSIYGFNEQTTRIVKQNQHVRFELIGSYNQPVKNITLDGFVFDGKNLESVKDGAAFYLENASDCKLNCRIENHTTWGDGGAIYAPVNGDHSYSVSNIEALNVVNCKALDQGSGSDSQLNEGGAAYGLYRSKIHAQHCQAERGGAVAKCKECDVEAISCSASRSGGAAYRCPQLRLLARDCQANMQNGKGGAAYYCSDLVCEGIWTGNNAAEAPHIYASNHLTGESEERHYWKGDYIGRRIDDDVSVWRSHNE